MVLYVCEVSHSDLHLWFTAPHNCTALYCTALHCIELYCTVLYCTVLYCTVLYCTALHCIELYCTVLYCTALHCIELYCTVMYCTVLCVGTSKGLPILYSSYSMEYQRTIVYESSGWGLAIIQYTQTASPCRLDRLLH